MTDQHSMRDHAIGLARKGFRVFKLRLDSKKPEVEAFPDQASSDPAVVAEMWSCPVTGEPLHNNIGISTDDLLVIDVDVKNGKQGAESLETLIDCFGLNIKTRTALTPSGGRHLYYRLPAGSLVRGDLTGKLGHGIDVRSYHNFVVAPGSTLPEGVYVWDDENVSVDDAPGWVVGVLGAAIPRKLGPESPSALVELDTAANIERATEWLEKEAPTATLRDGSDATTYSVAAGVKDFGISEPMCADLMLGHWNDTKSNPPWPPEKLLVKIENAYRYGNSPIGARSADAEFEAVDIDVGVRGQKPKPRGRLFLRSFDEARARALRAATRPLIKKFLDCSALSVVYGESNSGKTFLALDIAYAVATGTPWQGRKTTQAAVVYVAAEAGEGINARLEALARHHKPASAPPLFVAPCAVDLFDPAADLKPLIELIRGLGQPVGLVVVDTLARAIAGGDENTAKDMSIMVRHFDHIRETTGAHVMVVHHSGKDASRGARGSSALRAATDTEIEVMAVAGGSRTLTVKKQREHEGGQQIGFDLVVVDIGADQDGDKIASCVVRLRTASEFETLALTPKEADFLGALDAMASDAAENKGVVVSEFPLNLEFILESQKGSETPGISRANVYKTLSHLSQKGHLRKSAAGQWFLTRVSLS